MERHKHPPLKRHISLQPLSRDHYTGLVQAERMCKAAEADAAARRGTVARFSQVWQREIGEHFDDEERLLISLMTEPESARTYKEHHSLRAAAAEAHARAVWTDPGAAWCRQVGEALRDHIRWEERELFPALQERATPEQLQVLARHTDPIEQRRGRVK